MKQINHKSNIKNDRYTNYIYESYDIQNKEFTSVNISYQLDNLDSFDWNIIVVFGGSGSGKTSILKNIGEIKTPYFKKEISLISNFDWLEPKEATHLLTSVGLSSVPTWLRPFDLLSNGEQYRATIAYLISKAKEGEIILIDEFTSVVNRDVAKSMSFAIQKYIRKNNKRVIFASCHYDIFEWLMPDFVLSPEKGGILERGEWLRQGRPSIELSVHRCKPKVWDLFKKHHYLTEDVNDAYIFLLFELNNKPIAICVIGYYSGYNIKLSFRESRIVVLPDYQGMGIGSKISEFIAGVVKNGDFNYYTKTTNPALGEYRNKNESKWSGTMFNNKVREKSKSEDFKNLRLVKSYCHKYIGKPISGYEELLLPIDKLRYNEEHKFQLNLF
jgi:ABC-type lipoprotein export system ATPase subunit/ribosomal protein S18 acetylase RimI-like enzyme